MTVEAVEVRLSLEPRFVSLLLTRYTIRGDSFRQRNRKEEVLPNLPSHLVWAPFFHSPYPASGKHTSGDAC